MSPVQGQKIPASYLTAKAKQGSSSSSNNSPTAAQNIVDRCWSRLVSGCSGQVPAGRGTARRMESARCPACRCKVPRIQTAEKAKDKAKKTRSPTATCATRAKNRYNAAGTAAKTARTKTAARGILAGELGEGEEEAVPSKPASPLKRRCLVNLEADEIPAMAPIAEKRLRRRRNERDPAKKSIKMHISEC